MWSFHVSESHLTYQTSVSWPFISNIYSFFLVCMQNKDKSQNMTSWCLLWWKLMQEHLISPTLPIKPTLNMNKKHPDHNISKINLSCFISLLFISFARLGSSLTYLTWLIHQLICCCDYNISASLTFLQIIACSRIFSLPPSLL